jgi:hypothetical protein
VLCGHAREPEAIAPQQLVALAGALPDLAAAAGEDDHRLALAHQLGAVLAAAFDGADGWQDVLPQRDAQLVAIGEAADEQASAAKQFGDDEKVVGAVERVVADR